MDYLENRAISKPSICTGDDLLTKALRIADCLELLGLDRVARKLRCCGRCRPAGANGALTGFPCNSKACPGCSAFMAYQRRTLLYRRVVERFGPKPAYASFTLTPAPLPSTPLQARITRMRDDFGRIRTRQQWKKPGGIAATCGLIVATEFTEGVAGAGHPHLQGVVFGHDDDTVEAAARWLVDIWITLASGASPLAQKVTLGKEGVNSAWTKALNYAVKGNMIRLGWGDEFLREAVEEVTSGRHHIGAYGLLSPRRRRGEASPAPGVICQEPGYLGRETR